MAQKYRFVKHKTFTTRDDTLITEVEGFLKRNKMVIVAAWEERAEVYLEPDYPSRSEQPAAKSGGCFIATAACSDPFSPEVILLCAFRDEVLNASGIGRAFIRLYYATSPPIAAVISRSTALRCAVMALIVKPAVRVVRLFQQTRPRQAGMRSES